jgi:hypothetical protein
MALRLCGHASMGPRDVADQSNARISDASSPSAGRKSGAIEILVRLSVRAYPRNLAILRQDA